MPYNSTLKRQTPLKAKSGLKAKTSLKQTAMPSKGKTPGLKAKQRTAKKLKDPYRSIFSKDITKCYVTGDKTNVVHHIFGGPDKIFSETYGFMLPLRSDWHTASPYSIHEDKAFNLKMKLKCQEYWVNQMHRTEEEWIKECRRWYSDEKAE